MTQTRLNSEAQWTAYLERIRGIHRSLGISDDHALAQRLPLFWENSALVNAGLDYIDRDVFLTRRTADAWSKMRDAALSEGIVLLPVSGFRSVERQQGIIGAKLAKGTSLLEILRVNAAPGYSQHHSGCALDITDSETRNRPLNEDFESQPAFRWLERYSGRFGFRMEYPRENRYGFIYEPWHWVFNEVDELTFFQAEMWNDTSG